MPATLHFGLSSTKFPWPVILPLLLVGLMLASNSLLSKASGDNPMIRAAVNPCASPCDAANGGGPSQVQSARLVAALAEVGSMGAQEIFALRTDESRVD